MMGWECPRCHSCYSPTMPSCWACGPTKADAAANGAIQVEAGSDGGAIKSAAIATNDVETLRAAVRGDRYWTDPAVIAATNRAKIIDLDALAKWTHSVLDLFVVLDTTEGRNVLATFEPPVDLVIAIRHADEVADK